ncbi:phage tail protein [Citrobacter koseri]|uniref:phage tail-collar fiber domain-containing protein n=1 Tax=Citrobacter koseri TaxID=545 RepID=UPI002943485C|nr:phage tail protein [Citrobacter koseri]MEB2773284.1 phage tail protein [Citrobacter koseri]WOJ26933.1 phage tail protein [Citrobacter koseri]
MSQTVITLAFERWKTSQAVTGEPVLLDEFVFANVPGLDPALPIDRSETLPPVAQIVHRQAVSRKGVVSENAVVHSVVLGADVGDFSFNWIGLINKASGTLAMIVHAPEQQKLKTAEGQQGNVLTRSFLMEYNGAQAETGINTPAETWQIDFTARMAGIDERQRLENIDLYGAAAFFGDGYLVAKTGNQFFVTKGTGYVAGLRASLAANQNITVTTKPVKIWLDVCWTGTLTSAWGVQSKITVAANLADYVQNGVQHYVFAVASIDANGVITDLRPKGTLNEQQASNALKEHEKSRNHPDATTSEKGFVRLSSATDSDSETLAATPKAVKAANDNANARIKTDALTTSREDTVAGHVLQVGDYGLGVANGTTRYLNSIYDIKCAGFYNALGSGTDNPTTGIPDNSGNTRFGVSAVNIYSNQYLVTLTSNVHFYVGLVNTASKTSTWSKFYNTLNKPTAADVGAVPTSRKVNGRALTTDINVTSQDIFNGQSIDIGANQNLDNYQTPGIYAQPQNANTSAALNYPENYAGALMVLRGAGVTQIYYVYNSSRIWTRSKYGTGAWTAWAREYNTLNKPSAADVGALPSNGNAVSASKLQTARTINGVAFDGTKNITISAGSVGSYTKAESDARYVQNIRVSATQVREFRDGSGYSSNDAAFATAIAMVGGSSNVGSLLVRYVQKLVNGTWINITA